jgi:prepilin-type N-terminal cleavage/methylation domain-containing protein
MNPMPRRAFTLVELLVVIAIISIVAGLMLAGYAAVMDQARRIITSRRMSDILTSAQQTGDQANGGAAYNLQRKGLGDDFRFVSITDIGDGIRRELIAASKSSEWPRPNMKDGDKRWCPPNLIIRTPKDLKDEAFLTSWKSVALFHIGGSDNISATDRPLTGETLSTFEVAADLGAWYKETTAFPEKPWYRARWPHVTGSANDDPAVWKGLWPRMDATVDNNWPVVPSVRGWDLADPGPIVATRTDPTPLAWVRWSSPWGKPAFHPIKATVTDKSDAHVLGDLSPLHTLGILQTLGIVPEGTAGSATWRRDRGRGKVWNDAWGNPLVVASAVFMPLRQDVIHSPLAVNPFASIAAMWANESLNANGNSPIKPAENLPFLTTRDALIKAYADSYGYARAVYLTVGAVGAYREWHASDAGKDSLPAALKSAWNGKGQLPAWTDADDLKVVRGLWLQTIRTTQADAWTETSFATYPSDALPTAIIPPR